MNNPRLRCLGKRRRKNPTNATSSSGASTSGLAEAKEGDSDRDTGNECASSSSGEEKSVETKRLHMRRDSGGSCRGY